MNSTPAQRWVTAFGEGWHAPRDADTLVEHFRPYLDPHARMTQPLLPDIVGPDAFREQFARPLLMLLDRPHGQITDWAARGNTLYIDIVLHGTLGGKPIALRSCDRITLDDNGICTERVANTNPLDLALAIATRPRAWLTAARATAALVKHRRSQPNP